MQYRSSPALSAENDAMSMLHVCGYVGALWQANKQMCTINVDGKESVCVGRGAVGVEKNYLKAYLSRLRLSGM